MNKFKDIDVERVVKNKDEISSDEFEEILKLRAVGMSQEKIAERINRSQSGVSKVLRLANYLNSDGDMDVSINWGEGVCIVRDDTGVDEEKIIEIMEMRALGFKHKDIAEEFDTYRRRISGILNVCEEVYDEYSDSLGINILQ